MRKRVFTMIAALTCTLCCAFGLMACGGNNDNRWVSNCGMTINGEDQGTNHYIDLGTFIHTGNNPITKYTVYALYNDGNKSTLDQGEYDYQMTYTDYTGNASQDYFPDNYPIGSYQLKIVYDIWEISVNFEIEPVANPNQIVIEKTLGSLTITYGQSEPTIDFKNTTKQMLNDQGLDLNADFYNEHRRCIPVDAVANPSALTADEISQSTMYYAGMQLTPGQYYLFMTVPAYGDYAATHSNLLRLIINKAQLVVENADNLTVTYTYDSMDGKMGDFTAQDISLENLGVVDSIQHSSVYLIKTFANPTQALNATNNGDKLTINFAFNPDEAWQEQYYELPAPMDVTLNVEKCTLENPTISSFNNEITIQLGTSTKIFWHVCNFTLTKPDGSVETLDLTGGEAYKNLTTIFVNESGEYTLTITLKDKTNYVWAAGGTGDIRQTETITIADNA